MMIVNMALYGLKLSWAAFRDKLEGVFKDIQYQPKKADLDVSIRPAICKGGSEYCEMILCYVDDVLLISTNAMKKIYGINQIFKLKGDKADPPYMQLGEYIQTVNTASGKTCWEISSENYVRAEVINVEERLSKSECRLP